MAFFCRKSNDSGKALGRAEADMAENDLTKGDSDDDGNGQLASNNHDIVVAIKALEAKYDAAQKDRPEHDRQTLLWTKRTAKGVFIYTAPTLIIAGTAFWSAWNAQKAVDLTAQNFIVQERPYIWLTTDFGSPSYMRNPTDNPVGQVVWEWHFTNFSKTPANNVRFRTYMKVGADFRPSYRPAGSATSIGAPIPPAQVLRHEAVSAPGTTPTDYAKDITTNRALGISGVITYSDLMGNEYESAFCLTRLATGAIAISAQADNCHNQIK